MPIPVELPGGTYEGGYQHLYYKGERQTSLENYVNGVMDGDGYRRIVTAKGYTNERMETVGADKVLSLDNRDWMRSVNESVHDITHRDLIVNQAKLLSEPMVKAAIIQTRGVQEYARFVDQLKGLAASDKPTVYGYEKALDYMRLTSNTSSRAFNPVFALAHASGFVNAAVKVGPLRVGSAVMQMGFLGPWSHMANWIRENSVNMRSRYHSLGEGIHPTLPGLSYVHKLFDIIGMSAVHKLWEYTELATWKGAYDGHIQSGGAHAEAVRTADQAVNSTFGAQREMDKPQLHRIKNAFVKLMVNSMSYDNAFLNQVITNVNRARRGHATGNWEDIIKGYGSAFVLAAGTSLAWDGISDLLRDHDLESWTNLKDLGTKIALAPVATMIRSVPLLRMAGPELFGTDARARIPGAGFFYNLTDALNEIHAKNPTGEKIAKVTTKLLGDFLPIPTTQIFRTLDGIGYNDQHNEDLLHQFWRLMTGPPLKSHK